MAGPGGNVSRTRRWVRWVVGHSAPFLVSQLKAQYPGNGREPERDEAEEQHGGDGEAGIEPAGGEAGRQGRLHGAEAAGRGRRLAEGGAGQVDDGDDGDAQLPAEGRDAGVEHADEGRVEQEDAADALDAA